MTRHGEGGGRALERTPSCCVSHAFLPAGFSQLWNVWVQETG